jgi:anti-anti-sigma factor
MQAGMENTKFEWHGATITIEAIEIARGIRKISLVGRLDVEGTAAADLRLTAFAASARTFTVIDLSGLEFLASIGIGSLVKIAVAAQNRGGRLVLLDPQPNVSRVLAATKIDKVIPVVYGIDRALELFQDVSTASKRT